MRKILTALAMAATLTPLAAQAAVTRPAAVSYAAPANLAPGMRAGASVGKQSHETDTLGVVLLAAVGFGAGFLLHEWIDDDDNGSNASPN